MGIKISRAWNKELNKDICISEATDEMRIKKQLICHQYKCNAKLTWVKKHKVGYDLYTKFYRQLPKEIHSPNCENSPIKQVHAIAKYSDNKILENIENGIYTFRLNLVFEKDGNECLNTTSVDSTSNSKNTSRKELIVETKGEKTPYVSTMRDIMKLRSEVEMNNDLSSIIKLSFYGTKILWNNFYFALGEEEKCFKYIESNGNVLKERKSLKHIICSEFILKKENIKNENNCFIFKSTQKFIKPNSQREAHIYKVILRTKDSNINDAIGLMFKDNNDSIALVGFFQANIKLKPYSYINNDGIEVFNHDIDGWINTEEQIVMMKDFC